MTGIVRIFMDLERDIRGKHVLIVEDIIDSGRTLHTICEALNARDPASSPPNQEKRGYEFGRFFRCSPMALAASIA